MDLRTLSDSVFLAQFNNVVQCERKISAEILEYVKETERRELFLTMGCTSMFQFLTEKMGYTPGSAQRRIDSARMMRDVPEIKEKIKSGELNLMQISMLAKAVREKQKITSVSADEKRQILEAIQSQDLVVSEKTIARMLDLPVQLKEKKRIQKNESVRMEVTFTKEQAALLDQMKSIISHTHTNPTLPEVFEFLARKFMQKKKVTARMAVTHDLGCQWKTNGQICGSTFQLQRDHIHPLWAGGDSSSENFQPLCGVHNRLRYRKQANIRPKRH
jgi:hypothetical protein